MANNRWGQGEWGINNWGDQADTVFTVSGLSLTTSVGTPTEVSGEINQGWGRLTWGENAWGVAGDIVAVGQSLSTNIGGATANFGSSDSPSSEKIFCFCHFMELAWWHYRNRHRNGKLQVKL